MNIEKVAVFFERNEWALGVLGTANVAMALIFCFCLGYFTALFMGQLPTATATPVMHTIVASALLLSGFIIVLTYKICSYLDDNAGTNVKE